MIFFTADTHFNHENIIQYSNRPFGSLEEMTEALVANWNFRVANGDTVYHLGDFALSYGAKDIPLISDLLIRLNGQKILIKGNHDRKEVLRDQHWQNVLDYNELKMDFGGVHKQRIVLSHYAHRVWNQMHRGAWMLYGHSHGSLPDIGGKTMDVGVDSNDYRPISMDEVQELMNGREIITFDHHTVEDDA